MMGRKILLAGIFIMALGAFMILEGRVRVITPNGGETLYLEDDFLITWEEEDLPPGDLVIHLFRGNSQLGTVERGIAPGIGRCNWRVRELSGGPVTPGNNYKIRVRVISTGDMDKSDGYFTIVEGSASRPGPATPHALRITAPWEGQRFTIGSTTRVKWNGGGEGQVQLELVSNTESQGGGVIYRSFNTGSWRWGIRDYTNGAGINPGSYQLKITDLANPAVTHQVGIRILSEAVNTDLYISNISKDSSGRLTAWIRNRGNKDFTNHPVAFRIWEEEQPVGEPITKYVTMDANLISQTLVFDHRVQQNRCGTHIEIMVDFGNRIPETNETNNRMMKEIFFDRFKLNLLPLTLVGKPGRQNSVLMGDRNPMVTVVPDMASNIVKVHPSGAGASVDYLRVTLPITFHIKNCGSEISIRDVRIKIEKMYAAGPNPQIIKVQRDLRIPPGKKHNFVVTPNFKFVPTNDEVVMMYKVTGGYRTESGIRSFSPGFFRLRFIRFEEIYFRL